MSPLSRYASDLEVIVAKADALALDCAGKGNRKGAIFFFDLASRFKSDAYRIARLARAEEARAAAVLSPAE